MIDKPPMDPLCLQGGTEEPASPMPTQRCASRCFVFSSILLGILGQPPERGRGAAYQDAVNALNPSFYYQLNETSTAGGCIDSTGHATPGTYNGDYVNGPPQVGGPGPLEVFGGLAVPGVGGAANLAHYSNNAGHIILGPGVNYGAN